MIKLRLKIMSDSPVEVEFKSDESLHDLVVRVLKEGMNVEEVHEDTLRCFHVVLNGHIVSYEFWSATKVLETDDILISPRIHGGRFGQIFKTVALIAITVVASAYLGPGAGAGIGATIGGALGVAAVTIGASLLLNALIPPPNPGADLGGGGASAIESSQMYTLGSQSNQYRPYGFVPKVYGTHRMFPIVAASPYTTVETDVETGELVQYFHAIYDFGFGPLTVSDIKIGDTPIEEYTGYEFRLVDFNKPTISEGIWDDLVENDLQLYKGDSDRDNTIVVLNSDKSPFLPVGEYQVTRNASPNSQGDTQEITLDFTCPSGLVAFGTDGSRVNRSIELRVEFALVNTDDWYNFDDISQVDYFRASGGQFSTSFIGTLNYSPNDTSNYPGSFQKSLFVSETTVIQNTIHGYPVGTTQIVLESNLPLGATIRQDAKGQIVGRVVSETVLGGGFSTYTLENPTTFFVEVLERQYRSVFSDNTNFETTSVWPVGNIPTSIAIPVFSYLPLGSFFKISANSTRQVYATLTFAPKLPGQYKVRVTRETSYSTLNFSVQDDLTIFNLWTRFNRESIKTDKRHVFMELRIKATNQLNGNVDNLSAIVSSVLDVWNGTQWVKEVSNNPAWVYADLLTGQVNKRAITKDRLDLNSLEEWAAFCSEVPPSPPNLEFTGPRFECNFILDYQTTLQSLIASVTGAAQASLNIVDGKYGVLVDKLKTIPVQIFTPRNSWNFTSSRNYFDPPDALKVRYISPGENWQTFEAIVYDDGFDENTALNFDELSTFACTSYEQAWRFGRYMMAQARLRRETIQISVDFEYLVCNRGDFVQLTQDVMRVGGRPARVKTVVGNTITIDDALETVALLNYGYTYRAASGAISTDTLTVINPSTFEVDGDIPAVGDLIVIGEVGKIVLDCIVKSISPSNDLSAEIVLVEKADPIYDAESGAAMPPYDPSLNTSTIGQSAPNAVENLEIVENTWRVIGRNYQHYMDIDWDTPTGSATALYEFYVNTGRGFDLWDVTKETEFEYIVNPDDLGVLHRFKVLAVSATGEKISLVDAPEVSDTPVRKTTPPSDVTELNLNITNEILQLDWKAITDPDADEYLIRYSPLTDGSVTWASTIPLARVDRNTTSTSVQARTGTYLIKAVDFNGNESINAARGITSIPALFNLNVIEETNDFPALLGELDRVVVADDDSLFLDTIVSGGPSVNQYYSEGFYYYKNLLDLGEIYTVRLQSSILAEGFTIGDLMSQWNPLSSVLFLSGSRTDEWDVETQVRYTDSLNVISEWDALSNVAAMSTGEDDNFTPWVSFIMGDFTGRIFQFRLKLISNVASVSPRVFDGVIRADMPDRVYSVNDVVSNAGPTVVAFDPPFAGPLPSPNIQITQDDAQNGDYYVITNKTLSNFTITFYDSTNTVVSRRFDFAAKGYGRKADSVI